MYYFSVRDNKNRHTLSEAIQSGLASDGGLFVPEYFPKISNPENLMHLSYPDFSAAILEPYFAEDPLKNYLQKICENAFNFPLPLYPLNNTDFILELFHGPTLSFKDFGARFLAECLDHQNKNLIILVATSGDTGSAVASAFYRKKNMNVLILYPKGKVSARQEHQITCWDTNVLALAVEGSFDDCQRLVKQAFQDSWWQQHLHPSSANSINIGRLLPQITYYAYHSLHFYQQHQKAPGFIIPTGNLGHATAAYWAKMMGFPIREIVLSLNANLTIADYLKTGQFHARPSVHTLANAMDVGNPSNFERLAFLYPSFDDFKKNVQCISANDEDIQNSIKKCYTKYNRIICPHTATAFFAREHLANEPWIIAATADPSKFQEVIQPIIHKAITLPSEMESMLKKQTHIISASPDLADIQQQVSHYFLELHAEH